MNRRTAPRSLIGLVLGVLGIKPAKAPPLQIEDWQFTDRQKAALLEACFNQMRLRKRGRVIWNKGGQAIRWRPRFRRRVP